jgi:hypothetical protein
MLLPAAAAAKAEDVPQQQQLLLLSGEQSWESSPAKISRSASPSDDCPYTEHEAGGRVAAGAGTAQILSD